MPPPNEPPPMPLRVDPPKKTLWQRVKQALAPIGVVLAIIANFFGKLYYLVLPVLKFVPAILKTGGTMLLSIGFYAMNWGWRYAVGFVLLIFIHESGHLVVARRFGLKVGAPVFIPFMGAFIALKDAPHNAWVESCVGIGGPLFGAAGALLCRAGHPLPRPPPLPALSSSCLFLYLFHP